MNNNNINVFSIPDDLSPSTQYNIASDCCGCQINVVVCSALVSFTTV